MLFRSKTHLIAFSALSVCMRALYLLLTAVCLCLLSLGTTVPAHAAGGACQAAAVHIASQTASDRGARTMDRATALADTVDLALPGEIFSGSEQAEAEDEPPRYCDIWAADLLDPLDLLDEIEESGALFAVPQVRLSLALDLPPLSSPGCADAPAAACFKPPRGLSA